MTKETMETHTSLQADAAVAITTTSRAFPIIYLNYFFCAFTVSADSICDKTEPELFSCRSFSQMKWMKIWKMQKPNSYLCS